MGMPLKVVCVTFRACSAYNVKSLRPQRRWKEIRNWPISLKSGIGGADDVQGPNDQTRRALDKLGVTVVTATDLA